MALRQSSPFRPSPLLERLPRAIWSSCILPYLTMEDIQNLGTGCAKVDDMFLTVYDIWAAALRSDFGRYEYVIKPYTYFNASLHAIFSPSLQRWLRIFDRKPQRCELCGKRESALYHPACGLFVCRMGGLRGCPHLNTLVRMEWTEEQRKEINKHSWHLAEQTTRAFYCATRHFHDELTGERCGPLLLQEEVQQMKRHLDGVARHDVVFEHLRVNRDPAPMKTLELLGLYLPVVRAHLGEPLSKNEVLIVHEIGLSKLLDKYEWCEECGGQYTCCVGNGHCKHRKLPNAICVIHLR